MRQEIEAEILNEGNLAGRLACYAGSGKRSLISVSVTGSMYEYSCMNRVRVVNNTMLPRLALTVLGESRQK